MKDRLIVLKYSLAVERVVSNFLAELLGIEDSKTSFSLGNTSSSFSFSQKINLLIDIGALNKSTRNKIQHFMSIRNQFMHNLSAVDFSSCVEEISGLKNYLTKNYPPPDNIDESKHVEASALLLIEDVIAIISTVSESVNKNRRAKAMAEVNLSLVTNFNESIIESFNKIKETSSKLDFGDHEINKIFQKLIQSVYFDILERCESKIS